MEANGDRLLREDLAKLRDRLDEWEKQQRVTLEVLRGQIAELESRTKASTSIAELPPRPVEFPVPTPPPLPSIISQPVAPPKPVADIVEKKKAGTSEFEFGSVWLARLGIVILLTGLVLLGNFVYKNWVHDLPPWVRLLAMFGFSGALVETGRRLAKRPSMQRPGEVILAGGLAFFYYCTFAAYHVRHLKVIDSPVLAAILLFLAASMIGTVAWVRKVKAVAIFAIVLASYSTMLQPVGWLSCVSNLLLAAAGVLLMLRAGWAAPGIASMAGTYGAFLGWQIMGAANGSDADNSAILWFLPPVWAMYSLPGLLGKFCETTSQRMRAWFVGGNNAAFFALFGWLWVDRFGSGNFWQVCAGFSALLLALGAMGRRTGQAAGEVNFFQALALLSWAMILRLHGFQLPLAFAFESLVLAFSFRKFRSVIELVFSVLAAFGATFLLFFSAETAPVWSAGTSALLLMAAAVILRNATDFCQGQRQEFARGAVTGVFVLAMLVSIFSWAIRLPEPLPLPILATMATGLSASFVLLDRKEKLRELAFASLACLAIAANLAPNPHGLWAHATASVLALVAAWLWHGWKKSDRSEQAEPSFETSMREACAWAFSLATAAGFSLLISQAHLSTEMHVALLGATGLALLALGLYGRCERLAPCAASLHASALWWIFCGNEWKYPSLITLSFSLALLALFGLSKNLSVLSQKLRPVTAIILRITTFLATCMFCGWLIDHYFVDVLACVALLLIAFAFAKKRPLLPEMWGFLGIANASLFLLLSYADVMSTSSLQGALVLVANFALIGGHFFQRDAKEKKFMADAWAVVACAMAALWATVNGVDRFGWPSASVLWTLLGFFFVTTGLWLRLKMFRIAGFVLLAAAIIKVFAVDVWQFQAFMRVISFIVLGAALILLGLFYNRFSSILKQLLDVEEK